MSFCLGQPLAASSPVAQVFNLCPIGAPLGVAHAPSPDACSGHPALRSLRVRCDSPSMAPLAPIARLPGHGQPLADPLAVQAEGRKASGAARWTRRLVAVRPTPYGVGLGQEFVPNKPKAVRPRASHAAFGGGSPHALRRWAWTGARRVRAERRSLHAGFSPGDAGRHTSPTRGRCPRARSRAARGPPRSPCGTAATR